MIILVVGVILWCAVHLFPSLAPSARRGFLERREGLYKSIFSLFVIGSLVLIVIGWRAAEPSFVYAEPNWGRSVNMAAMLVALILFASGRMKTNIKRYVRHPQLSAVFLWSAGHLLANGDSRSVILFGGLGLWSVVEIVLINRRDGAWHKPEPTPAGRDLIPLIVGVVLYAVLGWAHQYFAGIAIY
ncbi:MAG: NnrU family protein [Alphaproteobacteria bacterium]|nr:NnrU family protein [Alphaproteobacteria bacterium]